MRYSTRTAVAAVTFGALSACSSPAPQCDCAEPNVRIAVPADLAAAAHAPTPSGACAGGAVSCTQQGTAGCLAYTVTPRTAGTCHIDVDFDTGRRFSADVKIISATGCCAGLYPDPPSAGDIAIPAGPDAG